MFATDSPSTLTGGFCGPDWDAIIFSCTVACGSVLALANYLLFGDIKTSDEKMAANTVAMIKQTKLAASCSIPALQVGFVENTCSFIKEFMDLREEESTNLTH